VIAALYVAEGGPYCGLPDVDPWTEDRDARTYPGPWSVVAHPPCAAWGRYSKPTPTSTARGPLRGDNGGCFAAALAAVRAWGGVLEHPRDSAAWGVFGLAVPDVRGWTPDAGLFGGAHPGGSAWVCCAEQGHYGHQAQKPTWLYYVGHTRPAPLVWGPSTVPARSGDSPRRGILERMSRRQRLLTPVPFRDALLALARGAR